MFELDEPNSKNRWLLIGYSSIKRSVSVVYDVLVKVDKFVFPGDFVVLDCDIDIDMIAILGRLFLSTTKICLLWNMVSQSSK